MTRPTKVQREILTLLVNDEEIEEDCFDYGGPCIGPHRHFPWRTFAVLKKRQWIRATGSGPQGGSWTITNAGERALHRLPSAETRGKASSTPG